MRHLALCSRPRQQQEGVWHDETRWRRQPGGFGVNMRSEAWRGTAQGEQILFLNRTPEEAVQRLQALLNNFLLLIIV